MIGSANTVCTAFEGNTRIGAGALRDVILAIKAAHERRAAPVLVFDDVTSHQIEVDVRGTNDEVLQRLGGDAPAAEIEVPVETLEVPRGPGRPRLGVVAREVTLLPRHWDWLSSQPGGASVALRKLVDEAKRASETRDRLRFAQESAYRFISVIAGNQPGFEEASRALFAGNVERFEAIVQYWPRDVREHASVLAARAFGVK